MNKLGIVIPGVKKNVAFPDDLVKKLGGVPLIQRAIAKALTLVEPDQVFVFTDSQEVSLLAKRAKARVVYDKDMRLDEHSLLKGLEFSLLKLAVRFDSILIYSPYVPLLPVEVVREAYDLFRREDYDVLVSVRKQLVKVYSEGEQSLSQAVFGESRSELLVENDAFLFFKAELITTEGALLRVHPYPVDDRVTQIGSYQDWWVCEKLLNRKRFVFRVIGNTEQGMGHIYRAFALAHEISDHEVVFVCDEREFLVVDKIAGSDYLLQTFAAEEMVEGIISLEPDVVINDILDTDREYVDSLREAGIAVINFEDLGSGAGRADLTFNELYDEPQVEGENICWGYEYFFLRDEFTDAVPRTFSGKVENLLITFGGTDQHDLARHTLEAVVDYCAAKDISIHIVSGPGYPHHQALREMIDGLEYEKVYFTYATGVMSSIMEQADVAISSNGRTTYELCHMNIPSIIVCQHEREKTHMFTLPENGFHPLGCLQPDQAGGAILDSLRKFVEDTRLREEMHRRMQAFDFAGNKPKVAAMVQDVIKESCR